jgi:UDP-glucose 4-epimerase
MIQHNVKNIIFSSSATVYGTPKRVPIVEKDKVGGTTNPYGTTKLVIEEILQDVYKVHKDMNIALLRYFNPIGANESGLIGEAPNGIPNNLMPYITQVAIGKLDHLNVFGDDYPTPDGTGVRDYIHVVDLALGHIASIKKLHENCGLVIYNLGTGKGTSVLELVKAFEDANDVKIPYEIVDRRPGDIAECYANCDKAKEEMGWTADKNIEDACRDSWRWQQYFSKHENEN